MALRVEDGTGVSDANSYIALAEADTYFQERGNAEWGALSVAEKEQALIRATDYLEQRYDGRWRGARAGAGQALSWPRSYAYAFGDERRPISSEVVPLRLRYATCELASRATDASLRPDLLPNMTAVTKEKVGSLEVNYSPAGGVDTPQFIVVSDLLRPLLHGHRTVELVRS